MRRSLDEGPRHPRRYPYDRRWFGAAMAGELNYRYVAHFAEDVVLVSDDEILSAMRLLLTRAKLVAEPSGAAAGGAEMCGRIPLTAGETVVALVRGERGRRDGGAGAARGRTMALILSGAVRRPCWRSSWIGGWPGRGRGGSEGVAGGGGRWQLVKAPAFGERCTRLVDHYRVAAL